jgi:thiol:disulfide interchange protein/DsbC/DsbD-like thiol-disulfide interchange protein
MEPEAAAPCERHRLIRLLRLAAFALPLAGLAAPAAAEDASDAPPRSGHVQAQLVSEYDALAPGQTATVGLRLVHEAHWHTYWIVPGDAGLPTRIRWELPPGFKAGPLQWPVPRLLRVGDLANYGYEGTVLLPVALSVPAGLADGTPVRLSAHADWLVCNDICIPEGADLTLQLPVSRAARSAPGHYQGEFATAAATIPQPIQLAGASALVDGARIRLQFRPQARLDRLVFFPLDPMRVQAAAPQRFAVSAGGATLDLAAVQPVAPDFKVLRGVLVADGGPASAPGMPSEAANAKAGWAGVIELPLKAGVVPAFAPVGATAGGPAATAAAALPVEPPPGAKTGPVAAKSLLVAFAGAFLGGLILNLMPCVFPVLSLKLLALVQHRERGDPSLAAHGFAFFGGAVASFVALAAMLVALRAGGSQLGWGFQLQAPLVIATLTALFFGIGLNLLGAFEVSFGTSLVNSKAVRSLDDHHLQGSFATGVLAAVVASPCTAPFMAAALGYAATQPAPVALLVFATLGAGMATPYLALTLSPGLLRRLPRPGAWMQHLRQLMAFPMFVTCVWLLWVLAQQIGIDALALVLASLVVLGLAGWAAGQAQRGARGYSWVGSLAAAAAILVMIAATEHGVVPPAQASANEPGSEAWADWSPRALSEALASGRPVFVDFTAAWCVTCQANKRLVLHSNRVAAAFAARGVKLLRADWTNRNDAIARELARFGASGVPLYVLYDASGRPRVLPEILTEGTVLDALSEL